MQVGLHLRLPLRRCRHRRRRSLLRCPLCNVGLNDSGAVVLGGVAVLPLRGAHRTPHKLLRQRRSPPLPSPPPPPPPFPQAAQADGGRTPTLTGGRERAPPPPLHSACWPRSILSPLFPLSLDVRSIFSLLSRCGGCMRSYSLSLDQQDRSSSPRRRRRRQGIARSQNQQGSVGISASSFWCVGRDRVTTRTYIHEGRIHFDAMGGKVFFEMANLTIRPSLAAMPDLLLKNHSSTTIQRACERREGANEQAPSLPQRKVGESERGRGAPLHPSPSHFFWEGRERGMGSSERASGSSESASERGGEEKRTSEEGRRKGPFIPPPPPVARRCSTPIPRHGGTPADGSASAP